MPVVSYYVDVPHAYPMRLHTIRCEGYTSGLLERISEATESRH
jgi:hypothetical protein